MSLIIKGMKLPENDGMKELVIGRAPNGTEPIAIVSGGITEFYKIIEVPALHGRLIDADELNKRLERHRDMCGDVELQHGIDAAICILNNTPTIIEAEVSE